MQSKEKQGFEPSLNRHKIKLISICVGVVIALCLFATRQDIMEVSKPFADNPLTAFLRLGK